MSEPDTPRGDATTSEAQQAYSKYRSGYRGENISYWIWDAFMSGYGACIEAERSEKEALQQTVESLRAALESVQWSEHDEYGDAMCPECEGYMPGQKPGTLNVRKRGTDHQPDCSIAAALAGHETASDQP